VESNRFKTDEVASTWDSRRDSGSPGTVIVDHLSTGPVPIIDGTRDQS
jgi:hypothetical protein